MCLVSTFENSTSATAWKAMEGHADRSVEILDDGTTQVDVEGDGSCQYHAFRQAFEFLEKGTPFYDSPIGEIAEMRKDVVKAIDVLCGRNDMGDPSNPVKPASDAPALEAYLDNKYGAGTADRVKDADLEVACVGPAEDNLGVGGLLEKRKNILNISEYADQPETFLLAALYNVSVNVASESFDSRVRGETHAHGQVNSNTYVAKSDTAKDRCISLAHVNNNHYQWSRPQTKEEERTAEARAEAKAQAEAEAAQQAEEKATAARKAEEKASAARKAEAAAKALQRAEEAKAEELRAQANTFLRGEPAADGAVAADEEDKKGPSKLWWLVAIPVAIVIALVVFFIVKAAAARKAARKNEAREAFSSCGEGDRLFCDASDEV